MRTRALLLGLLVFVLAVGLFLYGASTVQETRFQRSSWSMIGPVPAHQFSFDGETLGDDSQQTILGTTGIADVMILNTDLRGFGRWICPYLPPASVSRNCDYEVFEGNYLNITYLESYLQTHQSQIMFSRTIVNQNLTVAYPVTAPTNVTIVLAHIGSNATRDYWSSSTTHQTLRYPILGYTEKAAGTIGSLPNIALGTIFASAAATVAVAVQWGVASSRRPISYPVPIFEKCPACGHENLSFARKCGHCGQPLKEETVKTATVVQPR